MTMPSQTPRPRRVWDDPRIVVPDEATWAAMTPDERDAAVERIREVFAEYVVAMSEGVRHFRRKAGIGADLDAYFRRAGRQVFVACEMAVLYPGEATIVPDVSVVLDCDPDIEPESWGVADQKRGIDLVIEVRNLGKKHKDLVENVTDYARLHIPEYFSYDCRRGVLRGWRLPSPGATTYQPIVPQGGYLRSQALGLELLVVNRRLRFFVNGSIVPDAAELVARLQSIADERLGALDEAEAKRAEAEQQRADVVDRMEKLQVAFARMIVDACALRGVELTPAQHARVVSETDANLLTLWSTRVFDARSGDELFVPEA
ncbi:MAG: Uma2 family endonuclease [Polyangiales bacterium]